MNKRVTSIIIIQQQHISSSNTYVNDIRSTTLCVNCALVVYRFHVSDDVVVIQFLNDVGLILRSIVFCFVDHECPGASTLVLRFFTDGDI